MSFDHEMVEEEKEEMRWLENMITHNNLTNQSLLSFITLVGLYNLFLPCGNLISLFVLCIYYGCCYVNYEGKGD